MPAYLCEHEREEPQSRVSGVEVRIVRRTVMVMREDGEEANEGEEERAHLKGDVSDSGHATLGWMGGERENKERKQNKGDEEVVGQVGLEGR